MRLGHGLDTCPTLHFYTRLSTPKRHFIWKGDYQFVPCSDYIDFNRNASKSKGAKIDKPFERYKGKSPLIDVESPKLWSYLKSQESELRSRDSHAYKVGRVDEYKWYNLTGPKNLNYFEPRKIGVQSTALKAAYFTDTEGYVYAGARVYGLSLLEKCDIDFFVSLLNSRLLDFYVKHISIIVGGGFYDYGDQFIKNLPIPPATLEQQSTLSALAQKLGANAAARARVRGQLEGFPRSAQSALEAAGTFLEQDTLGNLALEAGLSKTLSFKGAQLEQTLLGKPTLRLGKGALTLPSETHGGAVLAALEAAGKLTREELLGLSLPVKAKGVQKFLDTLESWKGELGALEAEYKQLERDLNVQVYALFAFTPDEIAVVEGFLERF